MLSQEYMRNVKQFDFYLNAKFIPGWARENEGLEKHKMLGSKQLSKRKMLDPNNRESNEQVENTEMEAEETSGFLDDENNSGKVLEIADFSFWKNENYGNFSDVWLSIWKTLPKDIDEERIDQSKTQLIYSPEWV